MDNHYDTWNLRHSADFCTPVASGVYWVPYAFLGQTQYTNNEMKQITQLSPEEKYEKITNVYEVIQLFQNSTFQETSEKRFEIDPNTGLRWEYQVNPYYSHINNEGTCSEIASWAYYLLNKKYDEVGYLTINRCHNGHVINYVRFKEKLYFFDLNMNHLNHNEEVPIEYGLRPELYKKLHSFTGILTMAESFEDYIKYHNKIAKAHSAAYVFCKSDFEALPPLAQQEKDNIVYKIFPETNHLETLNELNNIKLLTTSFNPYDLLSDDEKHFYV